jgi:hypothetical protein
MTISTDILSGNEVTLANLTNHSWWRTSGMEFPITNQHVLVLSEVLMCLHDKVLDRYYTTVCVLDE